MKKGLLLSFALISCVALGILWKKTHHKGLIDQSSIMAYMKGDDDEDEEASEKKEQSMRAEMTAARLQYEYDMLKDPVTGKIPANIFQQEMEQAQRIPLSGSSSRFTLNGINTPTSNSYLPLGPNNVGGRTRAVAFDVRYNGTTNKVIISGCVSGGIMRSADGGSTWTMVNPDQQIHNIVSIAQDPRAGFQDTWYVGTGEYLGNSTSADGAFFYGFGIYKSTNNGLTWTALASTQSGSLLTFDNAFDFVSRIAVNPANGDVYAACRSTIERSQDGGTTWTAVKGDLTSPNGTGYTDIAINSTGTKIYAAFHLKNPTDRGVWQSTTGNSGSWTLLGGNAANTPTGWKINTSTSTSVTWGRIQMQIAPSNQNIIYVLYENGQSQASPTLLPEVDLFKLDVTGGGTVWTNLSANMPDMPGKNVDGIDPIAIQGGYDMLIAVKPDDANTVFVGGTCLYRSTSGFTNSTATKWIGGYDTLFTTSYYPKSHPDIHFLAFDPTNPNRAICGNDGGIQITTDITASPFVTWSNLPNYQTLQTYYVALTPEVGQHYLLCGNQDNGTYFRDYKPYFSGSTPGDYLQFGGGDGVSVDISNIVSQKQYFYFGSYLGSIFRGTLTIGTSYNAASIRPRITDLTVNPSYGGTSFGDFVTNFKLSNANTEIMFYTCYQKLFKASAASTVDSTGWTRLTGVENTVNPSGSSSTSISIRAMDFSWGTYTTSHAMYFGTNNSKVYRIDNYASADAATIPKDITPPGMLGSVADIAVNPNDDNEIMVVLSNYSTTSIWWTYNAKSTTPSWSNAEGNLTTPSIRSCVIAVRKDASNNPITEYYVGTSVGLYETQGIGKVLGAGGTIVWSREGAATLNYTVVTSMDYRPEDNTLLIGTHGNGVYEAINGSANFTPNLTTAVPVIVNDKDFVKITPTVSNGTYQYTKGSLVGIKSINIQAYSMSGQLLYNKQAGYGSGSIPLNTMPSGTYIIQITSDDRKYKTTQKVIKL